MLLHELDIRRILIFFGSFSQSAHSITELSTFFALSYNASLLLLPILRTLTELAHILIGSGSICHSQFSLSAFYASDGFILCFWIVSSSGPSTTCRLGTEKGQWFQPFQLFFILTKYFHHATATLITLSGKYFFFYASAAHYQTPPNPVPGFSPSYHGSHHPHHFTTCSHPQKVNLPQWSNRIGRERDDYGHGQGAD